MHLCTPFFLYQSKFTDQLSPRQKTSALWGFVCLFCLFIYFFFICDLLLFLKTISGLKVAHYSHYQAEDAMSSYYQGFLKVQVSASGHIKKIRFRGNVLSKISFSFRMFSKGLALLAKVSLF